MSRIAGVTIPTDKKIKIALTYVYGIGQTKSNLILSECGMDPEVRVKDMTETELNKIRDYINSELVVEGELQRIVTGNIKRMKEISSYRGERHKKNLPGRGQRTRTNARTRRGKRQTVGGIAMKAASKT